jgi:hypothetical protein
MRAADRIQEMCLAALQQNSFSLLQTYRPSNAEYAILSAEEGTPEQLVARLHLMSDDMGYHPVKITLPSWAARTRPNATVARIIPNMRPL